MSQTISGSFSTLVTLGDGGAYASPTTISATLQSSTGTALLITNPWTVALSGAILGNGQNGNLVEAHATASFDNFGTISGGASGINLYAGGAINNAATITGANYAVNAYAGGQNGAATPFFALTNSGYIGAPGAAGHGIFGGPGRVTNTGSIFGGEFAILDVTTVVNNGTVQGTGFGVGFTPGGTLENQSHGVITGGLFAVYGSEGAVTTLANAGYIFGGTYAGVKLGYGYAGNTGTIASAIGTGVYFSQAASLNNIGLIESPQFGGIGVSLAQGGSVTNTGTITGFTGIVMHGGNLTNAGLILGNPRNNNGNGGAPGSNATAIEFTAPGTFTEFGLGAVYGSIIGDGGALYLAGGSLAQVSGFITDSFAVAPSTLALGLAGLGTISGFVAGDEITLTDQIASSGSFYGHGLTLSNNAVLDFAGSYAPRHFAVTPDAAGGTDIEVACFLAGTRIATPLGELPVERLAIGDLVHTVHAGPHRIRWLGRRAYAAPSCNHPVVLPIRIAAGALAHGVPARDLFVSAGHAIWVAGALVPAGRLVNGASITQLAAADRLEYFHIELARHELLLAEACPAESLAETGFRRWFHNAPSQPGAVKAPALPRLEDGFTLQALARRLGAPQTSTPGLLRGAIDIIAPGHAAGWAQNTAAPETPVVLDLLCGRRRVARVLANHYRADLRRAGIGSGNHAFSVTLPAATYAERILRASDGAELGRRAVQAPCA